MGSDETETLLDLVTDARLGITYLISVKTLCDSGCIAGGTENMNQILKHINNSTPHDKAAANRAVLFKKLSDEAMSNLSNSAFLRRNKIGQLLEQKCYSAAEALKAVAKHDEKSSKIYELFYQGSAVPFHDVIELRSLAFEAGTLFGMMYSYGNTGLAKGYSTGGNMIGGGLKEAAENVWKRDAKAIWPRIEADNPKWGATKIAEQIQKEVPGAKAREKSTVKAEVEKWRREKKDAGEAPELAGKPTL